MDKVEYRELIRSIKNNYLKKDYEGVIAVSEQLDLEKIRENSILEIIAKAYEMLGRYDLARETLLIAYKRTPTGKRIAYNLAMLSIKLDDLDSAVMFYEDFCKMAPKDNQRLLLKYEIGKAGGVPIKNLAAVLEKYNSREMDDKWEYELARLYHEMGDDDRCAATCDQIILWYANGEYEKKALELKNMHKALNPVQQARYEEIMEGVLGKELSGDKSEEDYEIDQAIEIQPMDQEAAKESAPAEEEKEQPEEYFARSEEPAAVDKAADLPVAEAASQVVVPKLPETAGEEEPAEEEATATEEAGPEGELAELDERVVKKIGSAAVVSEFAGEVAKPSLKELDDSLAGSRSTPVKQQIVRPQEGPVSPVSSVFGGVTLQDRPPLFEEEQKSPETAEEAAEKPQPSEEEPAVTDEKAPETELPEIDYETEHLDPEALKEQDNDENAQEEVISGQMSLFSMFEAFKNQTIEDREQMNKIGEDRAARIFAEVNSTHDSSILDQFNDDDFDNDSVDEVIEPEVPLLSREDRILPVDDGGVDLGERKAEFSFEKPQDVVYRHNKEVSLDATQLISREELEAQLAQSGYTEEDDAEEYTQAYPEEEIIEEEPAAEDDTTADDFEPGRELTETEKAIIAFETARMIQENETKEEENSDFSMNEFLDMMEPEQTEETAPAEEAEIAEPEEEAEEEILPVQEEAPEEIEAESEAEVFEEEPEEVFEEEIEALEEEIEEEEPEMKEKGSVLAEKTIAATLLSASSTRSMEDAVLHMNNAISEAQPPKEQDVDDIPEIARSKEFLKNIFRKNKENPEEFEEEFEEIAEEEILEEEIVEEEIPEEEIIEEEIPEEEIIEEEIPEEEIIEEEIPEEEIIEEEIPGEEILEEAVVEAEIPEEAAAPQETVSEEEPAVTMPRRRSYRTEEYEEIIDEPEEETEEVKRPKRKGFFKSLFRKDKTPRQTEEIPEEVAEEMEETAEAAMEINQEPAETVQEITEAAQETVMEPAEEVPQTVEAVQETEEPAPEVTEEVQESAESEPQTEETVEETPDTADEIAEAAEEPVSEILPSMEALDEVFMQKTLSEPAAQAEDEIRETETEFVLDDEKLSSILRASVAAVSGSMSKENESAAPADEQTAAGESDLKERKKKSFADIFKRSPKKPAADSDQPLDLDALLNTSIKAEQPAPAPVREPQEPLDLDALLSASLKPEDSLAQTKVVKPEMNLDSLLNSVIKDDSQTLDDVLASSIRPDKPVRREEHRQMSFEDLFGDKLSSRTPVSKVEPVKTPQKKLMFNKQYKLSKEQRKELGEFLLIDGMEEEICTTIEKLVMRKRAGDETGGHLIVSGDAKTGKTFLTIEILKAVNQEVGHGNPRVAKVQAQAINGKNIKKVLSKVTDSDLIIENIGKLEDDTIRDLISAVRESNAPTMVILEGNELAADTMIQNFPDIGKIFKTRINIGELTLTQWADVAMKYANGQGYQIDGVALLALHARIDSINTPDIRLGFSQVRSIVDQAIERAEKRNSGKLFSAFSKKNGDGLIPLTEDDFI